jgi:HemK-like putative methylase
LLSGGSQTKAMRREVCGRGFLDKLRLFVYTVDNFVILSSEGEFDVIVSNPPYIETDVIGTLTPEVQNEPHIALDGGTDGLRFYRRLLEVCPKHIKKGGILLFEIGYDQRNALAELCEPYAFTYECYRDFGGNDRVFAIRF